jgi:peroxiredoxin
MDKRGGLEVKRVNFLHAGLIISVALNVALAYKLNQLGFFERIKAEQREDRLVKTGTFLPAFDGVDLNGGLETVRFEEDPRPTVLYIFSPSCHWCERNMDNLKELIARKGDEYRFIGISLSKDGLGQYVEKNDLAIPVYTDLSQETKKVYKLGATPQTIVVDPDGKVSQDWVGACTGEQQKQVEQYFGVSLPGLAAENK